VESFSLEIERRTESGKSAMRRLRREGKLPAIVYHRGEESVPVVVGERDFVQLAKAARSSQIFRFKSKDKVLDGRSAIVREVQKDHLKNLVLHIDFNALNEDEEVYVRVQLTLKGEAPGVKLDGGVLQSMVHDIGVSCLPKHIPSGLDVDISGLHLNQSIHARDLKLPEDVKLADDEDETIVTVLAVRTALAGEGEGSATAGTEGTKA
jgi:large subunit ribosomal protein L25